MWIRYNEVTVGPDPKTLALLADEGVRENLTRQQTGARLYHTGKLQGNQWEEGYHIDFDMKGGSDDSPDEVTVKIYNVADENFFGEGAFVRIKSGYLDYHDDVFSGVVDAVDFQREGVNRVLVLNCKDKSNLWLSGIFNKTYVWYEGTSRKRIVLDILQLMGLPIGHVWDDRSVVKAGSIFGIPKGWTIKEALDSLSDVTDNFVRLGNVQEGFATPETESLEMKYYFKQGRIYWLHKNAGSPAGWSLSEKTGLYSVKRTPRFNKEGKREKDGWDWTIKTAMIPGLTEDSVIMVEYNIKFWGNVTVANYSPLKLQFFKVQEFHYKSDRSEHDIELKCKAVSYSGAHDRTHWSKLAEFVTDEYYVDARQSYDYDAYRDKTTGAYLRD